MKFKFKENIKYLDLDFKKEMKILFAINFIFMVLSAIAGYFLKNLYFILIGLGLILVFTYFYLNRYNSMKTKMNVKATKEFVDLFTFFEIYITNGINVYKSLENLKIYSSPLMKNRLDKLTSEIDQDKSVQPFINFANTFDTLLINEVMISAYQLVDQGNDISYINQFSLMFSKLSDEERRSNNEAVLKKIDLANMLPLLGAGFVTIIVTFAIVAVIGDMMHG